MRKKSLILVGSLVFALAVLPALALPIIGGNPPTGTVLWDRYDRQHDAGVCFMRDADGAYWMIRYVDAPGGIQYRMDAGDRVLRVFRVIPRIG